MKTGKMALAMFALTLLTLFGQNALAADKEGLNVGDKAPEFEGTDDSGKTWKSSDVIGSKVVVVYFYPADFTGGCTAQACGFRDRFSKLTDKGVVVIGVSGDTAKTHALFKKSHKLPFTLLADPEGKIAKTFGVPTRKGGTIKRTIDGKELELTRGVSAARWTFVFGKDGKLVSKNDKVNARANPEEILKLVSE